MSNRHLIHEDYFVDTRAKGEDHFVVRCCITCGRFYCEIRGILADSSSLDSESRYDNGVIGSKKINKDIEIF